MNIVQPIRDREKLNDLKDELKKNGTRDYMLFYTGINSGMRVSDIISLKRSDIRNNDDSMKQHITVIEKKIGKLKRFPLCNGLLIEMDKYTKKMNNDEYLFKSRKGNNQALTTVQAYRIINSAAKRIGLEEIGTHTMRKTFGYFHYQQYRDIAILQEIFNHSSPSVTLRYIGINQDIIDISYKNFSL